MTSLAEWLWMATGVAGTERLAASGRDRRSRENMAMATRTNDAATAFAPHRDHGPQAVLEVAEQLYETGPEWLVFFREIMGLDGIVRRTFQTSESLIKFECSPEYARIREMLDDLRQRQQERPATRESQRVITVRMPRSLHETLKAEAQQMQVSINTLCISKLLKLIDDESRREMTAE